MCDDLARLRQLVLHLAIAEWFGQRHNARFRFAHGQLYLLRLLNHAPHDFARILVWWHKDVIIVHIVPAAFETQLAFDEVVQGGGEGDHFRLARLHAQRHPNPAGHGVHDTVRKITDLLV